ncbi:molybdopterin molybdotransferase MoeA [Rhodovibrionaceae bacterium A322]
MTQLSDCCFSPDQQLMELARALEIMAERVTRVTQDETLPLASCLGRILSEDLHAKLDVPQYDNSAVDGYAVNFDDLSDDGETRLKLQGRSSAGHPLDHPAERGTTVRIFTGAAMPDGPDTVFMQEDVVRTEDPDSGEVLITFPAGIKRGANRRRRGEDTKTDDLILPAGRRLRPQDIGLAAANGYSQLTVSKPLKVALFSTGDELQNPGDALRHGDIYDSNRFTATALLTGLGCQVTDLGILEDKLEVVQAALATAAGDHDLIITSGGVSVGEEDHVKPAVESQGSLHFWRLAVKPGRPLALGQVGRIPFVGLPGNPVAVMVTFLNVVRPMILRLMGGIETEPKSYPLPLGFDFDKKPGRLEWLRVHLSQDESGKTVLQKFPRQGSSVLSSMVQSDGLAVLAKDAQALNEGDLVEFLPFSELLK